MRLPFDFSDMRPHSTTKNHRQAETPKQATTSSTPQPVTRVTSESLNTPPGQPVTSPTLDRPKPSTFHQYFFNANTHPLSFSMETP